MKRAEPALRNKHLSPSVRAAPSPYSKHRKHKGNSTRLPGWVDCLWVVPSLDKCLLWRALPKPRADFPFWQGTGRGRSHPAGLSKQDFMQEAQAGQKPARAASSSVTSQTVSLSRLLWRFCHRQVEQHNQSLAHSGLCKPPGSPGANCWAPRSYHRQRAALGASPCLLGTPQVSHSRGRR